MSDPVDIVAVEEVVPDLADEDAALDLASVLRDIERVIDGLDLDVGLVTDEELHLIGEDEQVTGDDFDAPRLRALSAGKRRVAVDAVLYTMLARGDVQISEDDEVLASGRYALIAALRGGAGTGARLRLDVRGQDDPVRAAVYPVTDRMVLLEDVSPLGLHHFVLSSRDRAEEWLLRTVSPAPLSDDDGAPQRATSVAELSVDVHALAASAVRTGTLTTIRASGGGTEQRTERLHVTHRHLQVLSGGDPDDERETATLGEVVLVTLGETSAAAWAGAVVGSVGRGVR